MKQHLCTAVAFLASIIFTTSAFATDSSSEVLNSYQSAHNAKNIERVATLIYFRTQNQAHRKSWLKDVAATFSSAIASIKLVPFKEYAFMLPESELKRLPATFKPVNWLTVEFAPLQSASGRTESTNYLIGVENGKYFIIGP